MMQTLTGSKNDDLRTHPCERQETRLAPREIHFMSTYLYSYQAVGLEQFLTTPSAEWFHHQVQGVARCPSQRRAVPSPSLADGNDTHRRQQRKSCKTQTYTAPTAPVAVTRTSDVVDFAPGPPIVIPQTRQKRYSWRNPIGGMPSVNRIPGKYFN